MFRNAVENIRKLFVPGKKVIYKPLPDDIVKEFNEVRPKGPKPGLCYAPYKNIFFHSTGRFLPAAKALIILIILRKSQLKRFGTELNSMI